VDVIATVDGKDTIAWPADNFTYNGPAVSYLSRKQGPISGGTVIDVEGSGFDTCPASSGTPANMTVAFKHTDPTTHVVTTVPGVNLDCRSATEFFVTSPVTSITGPWDLVVTAYGKASAVNPNDVFTYTAAPALYSLYSEWISGTAWVAVILDGNAPAPITVSVASSSPSSLAVPLPTETIQTGKNSVSFAMVGSGAATVTATYNGQQISALVSPPDTCSVPPRKCPINSAWDPSECACVYVGNCKLHECY
jgi:hypothetical protein